MPDKFPQPAPTEECSQKQHKQVCLVTAGPGRLLIVPYAHMRAVKIRALKWESDTQV